MTPCPNVGRAARYLSTRSWYPIRFDGACKHTDVIVLALEEDEGQQYENIEEAASRSSSPQSYQVPVLGIGERA